MTLSSDIEPYDPAERLHDAQAAIGRYSAACAAGDWTPALDEELWRAVLGDDAPAFPYDSAPSEKDLRMNCAAYQCDHRGTPIELPLPYIDGADPEEGLRFLKRCVRWMAEQRGHDLCWEHADMLAHAAALTRGETAQAAAARPSLELCMDRCNRFAVRLYAAANRIPLDQK